MARPSLCGGTRASFVIISLFRDDSETCGAPLVTSIPSRVDGVKGPAGPSLHVHQAPQVNHDNDVSRQDRREPAARFQDSSQSASTNRPATADDIPTLSRRRGHTRPMGHDRERYPSGPAYHLPRTHGGNTGPRAARRIAETDCV